MGRFFLGLLALVLAAATLGLMWLGAWLLIGGELPGIILLFLGGVAGAVLIDMTGWLLRGGEG